MRNNALQINMLSRCLFQREKTQADAVERRDVSQYLSDNDYEAVPHPCLVKMRATGERKVVVIWEYPTQPADRLIRNVNTNLLSTYDILIVCKP